MKCHTCSHPQRQAIDLALLADNATFADLSHQYGLSISSLFRHKKHLQLRMAQTQENLQNSLRQGLLFQFNEYSESARQFVRTAGADGNTRQALQAMQQGVRILNSISKLEVKLNDDTVYRVLASPQWTTQDSLLPIDPNIITGSHQTLAQDLFFPCPEIPAIPAQELAWDKADVAAADKAKTSPLETPDPELPTLGLDLQKVLPQLFASPSAPRKTTPKIKREKSAKLPRNSRPSKDNNQQYQKDKSSEKITAKNPPVGRDPQGGASQSAAPPANYLANSAAPPANKPSHPHPGAPPARAKAKRPPKATHPPLETPDPKLETPQHESIFERLRRKWAKTPPPAAKYSCDSEKLYEAYLQEEAVLLAELAPPSNPDPVSLPETGNQKSETVVTATATPQPETPKTLEPLCPKKNLGDYLFALAHGYRRDNPPKHIPDRRWEEDFGNPRNFW